MIEVLPRIDTLMNGAILDFNLLLGKVAEMVFSLYVHLLKKVSDLLSSGCCNLVWIDYIFFLVVFCAAFSLGF